MISNYNLHISEGRTSFVRFLRIVGLIQMALGIALLTCGGLAAKYTAGSVDTFGPPYFIGAFLVGSFVSLLLDCIRYDLKERR